MKTKGMSTRNNAAKANSYAC